MVSFIIPIYNRPEELDDLLRSFTKQAPSTLPYEIIIVEDGSTETSATVCDRYADRLDLHYLTQENTGPSGARNHGAEVARGKVLLFLDSDTELPEEYLRRLETNLRERPADLFGGPDAAREDYTVIQQAISYAMTSFFTTGGIRGGQRKEAMDRFYPRTFNMGVTREAFRTVGGFRRDLRYGEDVDFSMRVVEAGYRSALYNDLYLYHKRRATYGQFFRQVRHSGRARITLGELHPGSTKLVHWLPALFVLGNFICLLMAWSGALVFPLLYALLILFDVYGRGASLELAVNCVAAAYVQLFGYGIGFCEGLLDKPVKGKGDKA